jgi:hypothetical protein
MMFLYGVPTGSRLVLELGRYGGVNTPGVSHEDLQKRCEEM